MARLPLLLWIYLQWIISISASSWPTPESWSTSGWVQKREEYKAEPHSGVVEQTQGDTSQGCTGQVLVFAWEWGIAGSQEKVQFSSNLPSKVHTVCSRTGSPELPQGHWNGFSGLSWKPFRPELWVTTPGPYLWGPSLFPWWPPTTTSLAWVDLSSCPTGRHPPPNAMLHHLPWSLLSQCPPTRLSIPVPTASHRPLHCPAFLLCLCPWLDCFLWPASAGRGAWYIARSPWVMISVQDPCREAAGQESWPQPCTPLHPQPVRSFQAWLKGSFSPLHHSWCPRGETPAFLSSSVATHVYRNRVTSMQMASHSPIWDGRGTQHLPMSFCSVEREGCLPNSPSPLCSQKPLRSGARVLAISPGAHLLKWPVCLAPWISSQLWAQQVCICEHVRRLCGSCSSSWVVMSPPGTSAQTWGMSPHLWMGTHHSDTISGHRQVFEVPDIRSHLEHSSDALGMRAAKASLCGITTEGFPSVTALQLMKDTSVFQNAILASPVSPSRVSLATWAYHDLPGTCVPSQHSVIETMCCLW